MELKKYWEIFLRRKWIFIDLTGIALLVAVFLCFLGAPIYEFSSKIQVMPVDIYSKFISDLPTDLGKLTYISSQNVLETQAEIIRSSRVVERVIKELNLTSPRGRKIYREDFVNPNIFRLISQGKGLSVEVLEDTEIIKVTGYSINPQEAVEISNKASMIFLELNHAYNQELIERAAKFIEAQLKKVRSQLDIKEEIERQYREKERLFDVGQQIGDLLTSLNGLEDSKNNTMRSISENRTSVERIMEFLSKQKEFQLATDTIEIDTRISDLKENLLSLELDRIAKLTEYTKDHPDIVSLNEKIRELKNKLDKEIKSKFSSFLVADYEYYSTLISELGRGEIDIVSFRAREKSLLSQIEDTSGKLSRIIEKRVELNRLSDERSALATLHSELITQLELAKVAGKMEIGNAVIIEKAVSVDSRAILKRHRKFPSRKKIAASALFLGVFLGVVLVFFAEYLDDSLRTPEQAGKTLSIRVLGAVPGLPAAELPAGEITGSNFWDIYWNIKLASGGKLPKLIAVTSALKGEGKSTFSLKLACVLSRITGRTLIVDANMRRPSLYDNLGLSNETGLSGLLKEKGEFREKTQSTRIRGLDFLASGALPSNPLELLDSPDTAVLIQKLKDSYDSVILDISSLKDGNEAVVLSGYADAVILVVEAERTPGQKVKEAIEFLKAAGVNLTGIVLNKARTV